MDKFGYRLDLATGRNLFQYAHPHHYFAAHRPGYLVVVGILVLAQVPEEIGLGILVLLAVGDFASDVLPHLVGQLCQHFLFLPAEKAATPQTVIKLFHVGRLFWPVTEPAYKLLVAAKVIKPPEYLQLLNEVGIVVDDRRTRKREYPFLATADALHELRLLRLRRFAFMAFVDDDRLENPNTLIKLYRRQSETCGVLDTQHKELFKALIIGYEHRAYSLAVGLFKFPEPFPACTVAVIKYQGIYPCEFFEFTFPIHLERGGADYKHGECFAIYHSLMMGLDNGTNGL